MAPDSFNLANSDGRIQAQKTAETMMEVALNRYSDTLKACPLSVTRRYSQRLLSRRARAAAALADAVALYRTILAARAAKLGRGGALGR